MIQGKWWEDKEDDSDEKEGKEGDSVKENSGVWLVEDLLSAELLYLSFAHHSQL